MGLLLQWYMLEEGKTSNMAETTGAALNFEISLSIHLHTSYHSYNSMQAQKHNNVARVTRPSLVPRLYPHKTTTKCEEGGSLLPFRTQKIVNQ